ncbi:MAG: hypothetical protein LUF27_04975 [Lachnospiraceae bacterium]|nr:hypothetical protein [Lachnospiraceae bacterium]
MPETNTAALAAPYTHTIGKVTFRVSSFGNPNGTKSATEMLVPMMEHQLRKNHSDKEAESA